MNVIDITLISSGPEITVEVYHNDTLIKTLITNTGTHRLSIDTEPGSNKLTLVHRSQYNVEIGDLSMFDLGSGKLKYLGKFTTCDNRSWTSHVIEPNGSWNLNYQYPVFSWLHKTLNFGWLINPDKE